VGYRVYLRHDTSVWWHIKPGLCLDQLQQLWRPLSYIHVAIICWQTSEWVKGVLHTSNTKRLNMDEKNTEIGEVNYQKKNTHSFWKRNVFRNREIAIRLLKNCIPPFFSFKFKLGPIAFVGSLSSIIRTASPLENGICVVKRFIFLLVI